MKIAIFAVGWMLAGSALTTVVRVNAFDPLTSKPVAAPHPVLSSEAVVIAEHFDARMNRLERLIGALSSDLESESGNTRTEIQNAESDLEHVCRDRS